MRSLTPLLAILVASPVTAQVDPNSRAILFIRGADGSGGATEGGTFEQRTEQLSDLFNTSEAPGNHGYASLRLALEADGFTLSQLLEDRIVLNRGLLDQYRVVVFGSNNRSYGVSEVQAFHDYVDGGGSALFISDANWGRLYGAAPNNDNPFLLRYGFQVYQDSGFLPVMDRTTPGRYLLPDHPILSGTDGAGGTSDVQSYEGEGVSLFELRAGSSGFQPVGLVSAAGLQVRLNTVDASPGPLQPAGANDFAMIVSTRPGHRGRVAGHFDRNTFFNRNGAGSNVHRRDHVQLARNLMRFLAAEYAGIENLGGRCAGATMPALGGSQMVLGRVWIYSIASATPTQAATLLIAPGPARPVTLPGGCVVLPNLASALAIPVGMTNGRGDLTGGFASLEQHTSAGQKLTVQAVILAPGGPVFGAAELSNAVTFTAGWPRQ